MRGCSTTGTLVRMELRCLVVDDNEEYLKTAARLLHSEGLNVVGVARDGRTALALTERVRPDVVLVDVELGDESGIDLVRMIGALPSAPATILISTYAEEDLAEALADSPAVGFVPKTRLSAARVRHLLGQSNRGT